MRTADSFVSKVGFNFKVLVVDCLSLSLRVLYFLELPI